MTNLNFVKLSHDYQFPPFDCEDSDLNEFLLHNAKSYQAQLLAVSYILKTNDDLVGFFCLSNDRLCKDDTNKWRKIKDLLPHPKRRNSYPAVRIGRLAIDKRHQRGGYGRKILNFIKYQFLENNHTGCRFLLVDAYLQSVDFYSKNGFIELSSDKPAENTKLMYFDLSYLRSKMQA